MAPLSNRQKSLLFLAGGILCFLAAFGLVWLFSGQWKSQPPTTEAGSAFPMMEADREVPSAPDGGASVPEEPWVIYVTGAVGTPGVYKVPAGSRIYEVVNRAGGLTSEADPVAVNLARPLQDGDHIHVPKHGESQRETQDGTSRLSSGTSGVTGGETTRSGPGKIDVNHASAARLESLPGIGPKTAAAIVLYRQEHGLFRSVEDLIRVRGIGPSKMEKVRGLVTVRP